MSLRRRLAVVAAGAAALAVVAVAVSAWLVTRAVLSGEIDDALREQARDAQLRDVLAGPNAIPVPGPGTPTDDPRFFTVILPRNEATVERHMERLPELPERARSVRPGAEPEIFDDTLEGTRVRFLATATPGGGVLVVARPTEDMHDALRTLAIVLTILGGAAIAAAFLAARAAARTAIVPVARLTEAAEDVAATRDLTRRIDAGGDAELRGLAHAFNTMLEALERSQSAQRRLVADASHELRTPMTSLRLNLEMLAGDRPIEPAERERLRADLVTQLDELTSLVGDLIEVARDEEGEAVEPEDLDLAEVAGDALRRARARHAGVRFEARLEPTPLRGHRDRLERAVGNLLENAARWSPPDGTVEVALRDRRLTVRDHGPGIPEADRPHVFERFYRAPAARQMPGSGLGLAIVRGAVEGHGGRVAAEAAPGGGALLVADFSGTS